MCEIAFELPARAWRRARHRASVRRDIRELHADREPPRLRADASAPTLLDRLTGAGSRSSAIGKIEDLFAGRGISTAIHTRVDDEGVDSDRRGDWHVRRGLIFANLVDFDASYGHRNDVGRLRGEPRAVRRAAARFHPRGCARATC